MMSKRLVTQPVLRLVSRLSTSRLLMSCLLVFAASALKAENIGLAWTYEKGGRSGTLLGSVHFADSSFYPLPPAIMAAYREAETLVVEIDDASISPEQQQALVAKYGFYPKGQTLRDHLDAKTLRELRPILHDFGLNLPQVEHLRPGMLAIQLTAMQAQKLGYTAEQGLDRYFLQKARYKKRIEQIETFEFQMALLAELPEDNALLRDSFANMSAYDEQWGATMAAWKQGDPQALYDATIGAALEEYPSLEPYFEVLFFDRHPKMVSVAEQCIVEDKGCFIVVGAGHLVGEKGLVKALQDAGYKLSLLRP